MHSPNSPNLLLDSFHTIDLLLQFHLQFVCVLIEFLFCIYKYSSNDCDICDKSLTRFLDLIPVLKAPVNMQLDALVLFLNDWNKILFYFKLCLNILQFRDHRVPFQF